MADVFVSYSRSDAGFVRELHTFLTGDGRDVWVDWEDIPPASEWERDINDSIDDSESFVFVASPASLASEYCAAELRHAEERGKRIVPLALDAASPEDADAALRQLNWIWCRETDDRDAAFATLKSALDTNLDWARAHTRLLVRAVEWDTRGDGSLLLRGKDLAGAERVVAEHAGKEPRPTELQQRYLHASRRAARRRQRALLAGVTVALGVAIVLGIVSLLQRNTAIRERNAARSMALASAARAQVAEHLDVGLLLGLEANRAAENVQARSSIVAALEAAEASNVWAVVRTGAPVSAVALSPDGRTLATGGRDGIVRLWSLSARRQLGPQLRGHSEGVHSLAFSHDGSLLATGDWESRVRLWNVRTGKRVGDAMDASGSPVQALAFAADDQSVVAVTAEQADLWDVGTRQRRGPPLPLGRGTEDGSLEGVLSPDGRMLIRTFNAGESEFWSVRLGNRVRLSEMRPKPLLDGQQTYSPLAAGDGIVAGYRADGIYLWNLRTRRSQRIVALRHAGRVLSFALSRDGRTLAIGGEDGSVRLSQTRAERQASRHGPSAYYTLGVAFTPDGRVLSIGMDIGQGRVGASSGPRLADVDIGSLTDVALSPDGELAVATSTGEVQGLAVVWRVATGRVVRRLRVRGGGGWAAAFSPDGELVATGNFSGKVRLWRVATGGGVDLPGRTGGLTTSIAFSPDGKLVAAADNQGRTRLWEVAARRALGDFETNEDGSVTHVAFSPDGTRLATAGADRRVRFWDVAARTQLGPALFVDTAGRVEDVEGNVLSDLAFSPDGRTIATGADVGGVRLWDAATRDPLGEPLPGSYVAFSPDGRTLLVADSSGGTARLWPGILWRDLADLRSRVCNLVLGNLTDAEWATHAPALQPHETCG